MLVQAGAAQQQVVAAAGALRAFPLLLPAAQTDRCTGLLQQLDPARVLVPAVADRQVHLQHAGIGGEPQHLPMLIGIPGQDATQFRLLPGVAMGGQAAQ